MTLSRRAARSRAEQINSQINGTTCPKQECIKYLGVTIDNDLSWKSHVRNACGRMLAATATIRRLGPYLSLATKQMLYNALVLPHADYYSVVWHSCNSRLSQSLEHAQNLGMRVILAKPPCPPSAPLIKQLGWTTIHMRHHNSLLRQVHRRVFKQAPSYLCKKNVKNSCTYLSTRGADKLHLPQPHTEAYRLSFEFQGAKFQNFNTSMLSAVSMVQLVSFIPSLLDCVSYFRRSLKRSVQKYCRVPTFTVSISFLECHCLQP